MNRPPIDGHARHVSRLAAALAAVIAIGACVPSATTTASPSAEANASPSAASSALASQPGSLVILGRIVTMDDPPVAEALLIEGGTVAAVGGRDEVLAK